MRSRRRLAPRQPAASPSLPDTRVVRNLGSIWIWKEPRDPRLFFVFQAPEEARLELCWSRLLRPPTDALDSIAGDPECRFGDPDAAVQHDPHFGTLVQK